MGEGIQEPTLARCQIGLRVSGHTRISVFPRSLLPVRPHSLAQEPGQGCGQWAEAPPFPDSSEESFLFVSGDPFLLDSLFIGSFAMWKVELGLPTQPHAEGEWTAQARMQRLQETQAFRLTAYCSSNHTVMAPTELMAVWCGAQGKFLFVLFPEGLWPPQVWQLYKNELVNSATPHKPFYGACCGNGH